MHRAPDEFTRQLAGSFLDWGFQTADSIIDVKKIVPKLTIFASGGLKDGLDIAKCLALGASLGGMASQFLKAAAESLEKTIQLIKLTHRQIQVSLFSVAASDLTQLDRSRLKES